MQRTATACPQPTRLRNVQPRVRTGYDAGTSSDAQPRLGRRDEPDAIQLTGGTGEAYGDSRGDGAGIISTTFIGATDMNEDGTMDAVLMLDCTGTPFEDCCAGRTSTMQAAVVLDMSDRYPVLIGKALFGVDEGPDAEPTEIQEVAVSGTWILTRETLVYPEEFDPEFVSANEGWFTYALVGGEWQRVEP